jgi:hypothetical protein
MKESEVVTPVLSKLTEHGRKQRLSHWHYDSRTAWEALDHRQYYVFDNYQRL